MKESPSRLEVIAYVVVMGAVVWFLSRSGYESVASRLERVADRLEDIRSQQQQQQVIMPPTSDQLEHERQREALKRIQDQRLQGKTQ